MKFFTCFLPILACLLLEANGAAISILSGAPPVNLKTKSLEGVESDLPLSATLRVGFFQDLDTSETGLTSLKNGLSGAQTAEAFNTFLVSNNFIGLGEGGSPGFGIASETTASVRDSSGVRTIGGAWGLSGTTNLNFQAGTANALSNGGVNRGTKLFIIVMDGTGAAGVFSASNWLVPGSGTSAFLGLTSIDGTDGTLSSPGVNAATEIFRGSLGSLVVSPFVPEPSSMTLLAVVGLVFLRRRR